MRNERQTGLLLALLLLVGCSSTESSQNNPSPNASNPDMSQARDMAGPSDMDDPGDTPAEPATDSAPDADQGFVECDEPDPPNCSASRRPFGCRCIHLFDRRCEGDRHCRPDESCQEIDGTQVCIYQPPPVRVCPGPDCAADDNAGLMAGAASRSVTPPGFETVKPEGLDGAYLNFLPPGSPDKWNDCGLDGLCPGDPNYPGADEGEGDGEFQGVWIAGFSAGRPAQYCPPEKIGCAELDCCVSKFAHDDIKVSVVAVQQDGLTVVFAALDTVGFFHSEIDAIRKQIPEELGVDLFIMASTHNHESFDAVGQWGPGTGLPTSTGFTPDARERIQSKTLEAITEAIGAMKPASAQATVLDVGHEGLMISDSRPPYIFDDSLPVVHFRDKESDAGIATMVSLGNHPEVLWSGNPYLTSDYPHYVRKYIREGLEAVTDGQGNEQKPALPGLGGTTVFFAGAVGGLINPSRGGAKNYAEQQFDDHSFEAADAVGQRVAMHVLQAYRDQELTEIPEDAALSFGSKTYLVEIYNRIFQAAGFQLRVFTRDIYNATYSGLNNYAPGLPQVLSEVTVVRLGPVTFFTAPGEVFPETLVGGFPNKPRIHDPVVGDHGMTRVGFLCDDQGLPAADGDKPCIVKPDQENPPDWSMAPDGPYVYELIPGDFPFFIGLGQDFVGYMVPAYDYEFTNYASEADGAHYEETNSLGPTVNQLWIDNLKATLEALP